MNKYFTLCFIFITSFLFAQNIPFKTQKGEVFKDDYKESDIILAEEYKENEFIIVRSFQSGISTSRGFYIEKYDELLNKISDFEFRIDHPLHEKYSNVIGVFRNQFDLYIIEIFYDLKSKNFICIANVIDDKYNTTKKELFRLNKDEIKGFGLQNLFYKKDDLDVMKPDLGVFELETPLSYDFFSSKKSKVNHNTGRSELIMKVNNDKTFFAIGLSYKYRKTDYLKFYLFNKDLETKFNKTFSNTEDNIVYQNIEINNDALFLTQKIYSSEFNQKKDGGKYNYEIIKITENEVTTQKIDVQNHYVSSLRTYSHNDKIYSFGFYSDEKDYRYTGVCFFELDAKSLSLNKSKYNLFNEQFISDKYGKITDKDLKNIELKSVFFNNNEILINAEEVYFFSSNGVGGSSSCYGFDDIISVKLNFEGNLEFARNINKKQCSASFEDIPYASYSSFFLNNKNYIFINSKDEIKKLSNDRIEFRGVGRNRSNLNVITIDEKGDFEFNEILDDESNEVPFMVSKGFVIDNSIFFLGRKRKEKQLLKVTLE